MSEALLPAQFADLAGFVGWDSPSTAARYAMRLKTGMGELQTFHDDILRRGDAIKAYLDAKDFADYDEADRRLGRLMFAWVQAAIAVEIFKQPRQPDASGYWIVNREPEL